MGMKYDEKQAQEHADEINKDGEQEAGAAIDPAEMDAIAAEAGAEEAPESSGELMEEQEGPSTSDVLYPLISFGCDLGCPNWMVQDAEKKALSDGYADMIDKYWPGGVSKFGVELNALLMTAAIFGPRVAKGIPARDLPKREEKQEQTGESKEANED